jgi:hypothetical protein
MFPRAPLAKSRSKFHLWLDAPSPSLPDCIVPVAMNLASRDRRTRSRSCGGGRWPIELAHNYKVLFNYFERNVHVFHMDEVHYFSVQNLSKLN